MSKKTETRENNKHERILQAAIKVFAGKGFFHARISDIAKEARVADGTIYLYFESKYDILLSIFEEEVGKLIDDVKSRIDQETNPQHMLEIFASHHLSMMNRKTSLAEVIQIELRQTDQKMKEYRNTRFSEYVNLVSAIIKQGQAEGIFRKDVKPGIAKRAFFGSLDEVSRVWTTPAPTSYEVEETARQVASLFMNGLLDKKTT